MIFLLVEMETSRIFHLGRRSAKGTRENIQILFVKLEYLVIKSVR